MKKSSLVLAASFSLLSFSAVAGGDCSYGHKAEIAKVEDAVIISNEVDPTLVAMLKKQQDKTEKLMPIATFN